MQRYGWIGLTVVLLITLPAPHGSAQTEPNAGPRFFYSGDGHIHLFGRKNNQTFDGRYRTGPSVYDAEALAGICRVFDAPCQSDDTALSLRLVEFLDLLQDRLSPGGRMTITSGYRSPQYNRKLRSGGRLAAKASLHQYGMAADLILEGVPARRLWEYVKALGFGGAGYYHGQTVHIDVGPARSWDETTSGVGTGMSDDNKLIGIVTDFDVYRPEDAVLLRFIRMTAFPIAVAAEFVLEAQDAEGEFAEARRFMPSIATADNGSCRDFNDIAQMASLRWRLPADLPAGRYRIRARFCENPYDRMPAQVGTPVFVVDHRFDS